MADTTAEPLIAPFQMLTGLECVRVALKTPADGGAKVMLRSDMGRGALGVSVAVQIKMVVTQPTADEYKS